MGEAYHAIPQIRSMDITLSIGHADRAAIRPYHHRAMAHAYSSRIRLLYQFLGMKTKAHRDSRIHLMHQLMIQPSHTLPQTPFIQRPDLLQ